MRYPARTTSRGGASGTFCGPSARRDVDVAFVSRREPSRSRIFGSAKHHDRQLRFLVAATLASLSLARARRDAEPDVFASATDDTRVSLDADPSSYPPRAPEPPAGSARRPFALARTGGKNSRLFVDDAFARSTRRRHAAPRRLRGVARGGRARARSRRCRRSVGRRYHQAHRTSRARTRRKP